MVFLLLRDMYKVELLSSVPKIILLIIIAIALFVNILCLVYWIQQKHRMIIPSFIHFTATIVLSALMLFT